MNLIELYDSLPIPDGDERIFNAIPVPKYSNFRIAVNLDGNPIILLSVINPVRDISLKNFRLKYLQLEQNVECKILENGTFSFQSFTVITFTGNDRNLQEYFLRIAEILIKTIGNRPTQPQIITSLNKFVEIFRALTDAPTKTVHGLWTELFLINNSSHPEVLLNYWHNISEEKFDFNSGIEKIEVKSNSFFERVHMFSSEQLNPPSGTQVLIASIFIRQNSSGLSIQHLVDSISIKIKNNIDLLDKLNNLVCKTLGNTLEQSIRIKFDYDVAKQSLNLYKQQDIKRIEEIHIPNEVSEVKYKSDLSELQPIKLDDLRGGDLFNGL